jgi:hypothetical protein
MVQRRRFVILAGAAAAALAVLRHGRHAARGHQVPGGILIGDAAVYDTLSRLLLGPFLARIAADVAAVAPEGARVLEVGCGPGHLSGPAGPPARPGGDRPGLGPGHDRSRPGQHRPGRESWRVPTIVPGGRRGPIGVPRPILRPGRQHPVDAPLGRPDGRPGRDRPRAAPRRPSAHLGLPAWCPATSVQTTPCAHPRSGQPHPWLLASGGECDALALEVPAHSADRTGPLRWVTLLNSP